MKKFKTCVQGPIQYQIKNIDKDYRWAQDERPAKDEASMSIIRLQDVTVSFDSHVVLKNVNLEIQAGESFVIVGPSGQGKTTLLKTLSGLVSPQDGKVFIEQQEWLTLSNKERLPI
ncbi:MAG: ATP-binding cassette domain-containing protein, partial [Bdellovibrio sp.]